MDVSWPRWFQRVVQQNEKLTGLPASFGNQATLLGDYQASIDAMAAEIDTATPLRARRVLHRRVG